MARDTIKLTLEGEVSMTDLQTAVNALVRLLETLVDEKEPGAPVEWVVSDLRSGSATVVARGRSDTDEGRGVVDFAVDRYARVWENAQAGRLGELSPSERDCVMLLTSYVNGRIPRVSAGTEDETYTVDKPVSMAYEPVIPITGPRPSVRTSIKGKVVTLDSKQAVYFTLKEAFTNRLVRCYPSANWMAGLAEYWKARTWVLVEGTFNRFTTLPTLTEITDIVPIAPAEPGEWRKAFGIAPAPDGSTESSADVVRRIRDAQ
jgi:hypothetical protein